MRNASFLASYISGSTGFTLETEEIPDTEAIREQVQGGMILLLLDRNAASSEEGYTIVAGQDGIEVTAPTAAGIFYGIQTIRKAVAASVARDGGEEASEDEVLLPAVRIEDAPEFGYRGAHFDVCRHFFTVEEVKEYIDMMALHNMNRLHWHITHVQGWRVEIIRYPILT